MHTRHKLVIATFLLSLLLYIDRACISAAKGPITEELDLSDTQFGWVLSIFALGYALAQTPSGAMADKLGPRKILASVVVFWSFFTAMTGAAYSFVSLMIYRFLFGVGEAGAFPGMARATFSWIPIKERGLVTGINFSASRLGGSVAMFAMPPLIASMGWRSTFYVFGAVGIVWAVIWYLWFRDEPTEHPSISDEEKEHILATRQQTSSTTAPLTVGSLFGNRTMWLTMTQYFCSNFTFFFALTWLYPWVKKTYDLDPASAGALAAIPLLGGAIGNWCSGFLIDKIYRSDKFVLSRRLPAVIGFSLATIGLLASLHMSTATGAIIFLTIAVFGADMTLSPSWSFCVDIGGRHAGSVSGTMNMAGNIGAFITSLAFPTLTAWFGSTDPFFYIAAGLNAVAVLIWFKLDPRQPLLAEEK